VCAALCSRLAAAEHVAVEWAAPQACPSEASLRQAVEAHLGQPLALTREQPLNISAQVVADRDGYTARLRFQSGSGLEERVLEHPECPKLLDAAALVIALAIDPERVNARQAPGAPPTAEPAVAAPRPGPALLAARPVPPALAPAVTSNASPARDGAPPSRPERRGTPLHYPMSVFGLLGGQALPGVGAGVGVDIGLARGHFELSLVARYWLPRSRAVPDIESAEISLAWLSGEVRGCGVPWLGAVRLRLCGAVGGGDLWGRGVAVGKARTRHTGVPTLSAEAALAYGHGKVSPFLGVSADWLMVQPRLGVTQGNNIIEVYASSPVALSGLLGLTYRL
jgi:hypothetical protein